MIKNFINPEEHQNPISGSKVMAILLKGWILPIGGASAREGLCLQPAQQSCYHGLLPDKVVKLISWVFQEFLMTLSWLYHGFYLLSHDFLRTLSWLSHDFLLTLSWFRHTLFMTISWLYYDFLTIFSWISHVFLMTFSWLLYFHMFFSSNYLLWISDEFLVTF